MATKTGTAKHDSLVGTKNDDTLIGLAGNDELSTGNGGSDLLFGGNATYKEVARNGADTYIISPQSLGSDKTYQTIWVIDYATDVREIDVLDLSQIVSDISELEFQYYSFTDYISDLLLTANHPTDSSKTIQIAIYRQFSKQGIGIEALKVGNKTWNIAFPTLREIEWRLFGSATEGDDNLRQSDLNTQALYGLGGNDQLIGDNLYGGMGDDTLTTETAANQTLNGGSDNAWGTEDQGNGSDTFLINPLPPSTYPVTHRITIKDASDNANETDTLDLTGIASKFSKLWFSLDLFGDDLVISTEKPAYEEASYIIGLRATRALSGTVVTITDQFEPSTLHRGIEYLAIGDRRWFVGHLDSPEAFYSSLAFNVTEGDDVVHVDRTGPTLVHGLEGDDTLHGAERKDHLIGGQGADVLYSGKNGNDHLSGSAVEPANYNFSRIISKGNGSDTYIVEDNGDHQKHRKITVTDYARNNNESDILDITTFVSDISRLSFSGERSRSIERHEAVLLIKSVLPNGMLDDTIRIPEQFSSRAFQDSGSGVEFLRYGNKTWRIGNCIRPGELTSSIHLGADNTRNILKGETDKHNEIHGFGAADRIYGGQKSDSLWGGRGNDKLFTGVLLRNSIDELFGGSASDSGDESNGSDTYILQGATSTTSFKSGKAYIYDYASTTSEEDILDLSNIGAPLKQLSFGKHTRDGYQGEYSESSLVVYVSNSDFSRTNEVASVWDQFKDPDSGIGVEVIKFKRKSWSVGNIASATELTSRIIYGATDKADNLRARSSSENTIWGLDGNDVIRGTVSSDTLFGGNGDDTLWTGLNGTDQLHGGSDTTKTVGNNGADTYIVQRPKKSSSEDQYEPINVVDLATSVNEKDTLILDGFADSVYDLTLVKQGTKDLAIYRTPPSFRTGLPPYSETRPVIIRSQFDRKYDGRGIETLIFEEKSVDLKKYRNLTAAFANLAYGATEGDDTIVASEKHTNEIHALGGNDTIIGAKIDKFTLGRGVDTLHGGKGNDRYVLTRADSVVEKQNQGIDTVISSATYQLPPNVENLTLKISNKTTELIGTGNQLDNTIKGSNGSDELRGRAGNDLIRGGNEIDFLKGGTGNDQLFGGNGIDILLGQEGNDTLSGGNGADIFGFQSSKQGSDVITDFRASQGDQIVVEKRGFASLSKGPLAPFNFTSNPRGTASSPHTFFTFSTSQHALYYDPDGNGAAARSKIATVTNGAKLSHKDILVG